MSKILEKLIYKSIYEYFVSNELMKVPVIPNCLSLNINPSCHFLSKAFDTSRKIAHTSLPESRDL
jgi:hypothetical protein